MINRTLYREGGQEEGDEWRGRNRRRAVRNKRLARRGRWEKRIKKEKKEKTAREKGVMRR